MSELEARKLTEELERLVDDRIVQVLRELEWQAEAASGWRWLQPPVRAITASGCKAVREVIMRRWFERGRVKP